jgi:hypothetical protein
VKQRGWIKKNMTMAVERQPAHLVLADYSSKVSRTGSALTQYCRLADLVSKWVAYINPGIVHQESLVGSRRILNEYISWYRSSAAASSFIDQSMQGAVNIASTGSLRDSEAIHKGHGSSSKKLVKYCLSFFKALANFSLHADRKKLITLSGKNYDYKPGIFCFLDIPHIVSAFSPLLKGERQTPNSIWNATYMLTTATNDIAECLSLARPVPNFIVFLARSIQMIYSLGSLILKDAKAGCESRKEDEECRALGMRRSPLP